MRVRLADQVYRVERPFGVLPAGLGTVSDVAVNADGGVLALCRRDPLLSDASDAVVEFSPTGECVRSWGAEIADAHMLFSDPVSGEIVIVDRDAHQLLRYSWTGELVGTVGERHSPGRPFGHPTDVTRMPGGEWIVSDGYGNAQVHVFSADWKLMRSIGKLGTAPGEFLCPHSVAPLDEERFVVVDRENHRLQVLRFDGHVEAVWTGFFRPQSVWIDNARRVFVTDAVLSMSLLSATGERLGRCRPVLNGAHGLCGNNATGELYLAEGSPSRITRLVPMPISSDHVV